MRLRPVDLFGQVGGVRFEYPTPDQQAAALQIVNPDRFLIRIHNHHLCDAMCTVIVDLLIRGLRVSPTMSAVAK